MYDITLQINRNYYNACLNRGIYYDLMNQGNALYNLGKFYDAIEMYDKGI